jgi:hypothetical protein
MRIEERLEQLGLRLPPPMKAPPGVPAPGIGRHRRPERHPEGAVGGIGDKARQNVAHLAGEGPARSASARPKPGA